MAAVEAYVEASAERCFEVLSDPRSYAYWVVGSREVKDAGSDWPAVGSKLHHTIAFWLKDHTVVEEMEPNRKLRLRARARPAGTAFVTVTMRPEGTGTRIFLEEGPADPLSRLAFNPITDRILRWRNRVSVDRLKDLAEGSVPVPSGDLGREAASAPTPAVSRVLSRLASGFGRGFLSGIVGGIAMSASTALDMRLTGRGPSSVPGRAIERSMKIEKLGEAGSRRVTLVAHFAVSGLTGGAWGTVAAVGPNAVSRGYVLFGLAVLPDLAVVPAMRLAPPPWRWSAADMARTGVHHGVFALMTSSTFARLEG